MNPGSFQMQVVIRHAITWFSVSFQKGIFSRTGARKYFCICLSLGGKTE